jgi:hypothetical protein
MPHELVRNPGWNVKKPLVELSATPKACDDFNGGPGILLGTPIRIISSKTTFSESLFSLILKINSLWEEKRNKRWTSSTPMLQALM